jgi:hypothetical protein
MTQRILIAFLILICSYVTFSFAQNGSLRAAFLTIDSLYNSGSYLNAEVEARRLLEYANLSDTAYAEIHKYIAFSLIAQGKSELAKERFAMLLSIYPTYSLDPVLTSPKILIIFNEAKRAFLSSKKPTQETIKIPIDVGNSPISYRSILFPGWEQLHTGRKMSGIIFLSAGILTLGSGITFEFLRINARQDYLTENNPSEFDGKYKTYNRYYKAETASFVAFAITYIASEFDVFTAFNNPAIIVQSNLHPGGCTGITFALKF